MPVSRHLKDFLLHLMMLVIAASAHSHGNSANELVDAINHNRTAHKLSNLYNNPGLGCMALQYLERCEENCTSSSAITCQPPEDDITEIFAPNCGVELPTVDSISGRLIRCHSKYLTPDQAFSEILFPDNKTLSMISSKQFTEVGVAIKGKHKGIFLWGVLFSSGQTNSTFVLEGGHGLKQKRGCYSGIDTPCNSATTFHISVQRLPSFALLVYFAILIL